MLRGPLAILLALGLPALVLADEPSDEAVATALVQALGHEDPLVVAGVTLDGPALRALYDGRAGSRLWRAHVDAVTDVLHAAADEGLDPANYHVAAIAAHAHPGTPADAAALDLLVSDAVLRYARDVRYGRTRPAHVTPEMALEPVPDVSELVRAIAASPDPGEAMRDLPPAHPEYRTLRALLATYRKALAEGQRWPVVPDGEKIRPGASDPGIPALRTRLHASGELASTATKTPLRYDPALVDAVKRFQTTHGLSPDGVVGPNVRAALNVGIAERIEQIAVNMERWRWLPSDLGARHVMVNIADFRLRLVEPDEPVVEIPIIVGEPDKMTPMFSSAITHVIFNPSWTVPDKIARKELLPKVERDGSYFEKQGIRLIGGWQPRHPGDDPEKLDWGNARHADGFRLRQAPGPQNPLGRVKFHIPNPFGVYLHDTNSKNLFRRERRTLSHGCVRVGDALGLADHLLASSRGWSPERRDAILSDWKTKTITLTDPMPVHLVYETAWVDADGRPHFIDDPYGRDRRLADALAGRVVQEIAATVRTAEP